MESMRSSDNRTGDDCRDVFAVIGSQGFSVLRDMVDSLISLVCFHAVWDIFAQYSDAYGNVLWYVGDWVLLLMVASLYSKILKGKR